MTSLHVIVLAGGTARRLGGASKPDVVVSGRRLLDRVLDSLPDGGLRVVVAPDSVAVPVGVYRTLEDPPLGGPAAGIRAGHAVLRRLGVRAGDLVAVVPCDAPRVGRALPDMACVLLEMPEDGPRAVTAGGGGGVLPLVARSGALGFALDLAGDARDMSVRRLIRPLAPVAVVVGAGLTDDLDTWEDVDGFRPA